MTPPQAPEIPSSVPRSRLRRVNAEPVREGAEYVLYWMIAHRRPSWSFALDRAVDWARELDKPLVVLEALRCGYPWASDRLHAFVIQGMADNQRAFSAAPVFYYPYLEPEEGAGKGLLAALAERAAVVVTDDFPCFFLPRMVAAAGEQVGVRMEKVDGNGLLPMGSTDKIFKRAVDLRRHLQKELGEHLADRPRADPFAGEPLAGLGELPAAILDRWPRADLEALAADPAGLAGFPIDHDVPPVSYRGGSAAAEGRLQLFLDERLDRYEDDRRDVLDRATSELSPYLHFGHVSAHRIFAELAEREDWNPSHLGDKANGARQGWWGMSSAAESFLDELVTWRELGYNTCAHTDDYAEYESLPDWALETLRQHAGDRRQPVYDLETFETAGTYDELWNAAQRELLRDGRIHNYLRMLWGKKIFEWSATPSEALAVMVELNNKYAVDGRNPNSYSGIFWCLGRYDRAWGPERPIYGKIRYMTSDSTRRKLDAKGYIEKFR